MTKQPRLAAGRARALGLPTRGTTNPNRLRRMDNWIADRLAVPLRRAAEPLVVDLGYGQSPVTAVELLARLRRHRPDVEVLGLEIDPERVAAAQPATRPGLSFELGGFELAGRHPVIVRAANVLRQYPPDAVGDAWARMCAQLAPGGALVEGTCDELGRRASWVLLDAGGPVSLTLSCRLAELRRPSDVADRLVKALISRNVPGEPIHRLLRAMDAAWDVHAPLGVYGPRQRWQAMAATLAADWPVLSTPARHRMGELTLEWQAVAPVRQ
ncbi:class I SAM-dependent methyltransferase [Jatrophihabitans sp.]|uniref:class I SAM-dependent methyltransferase n=1 Tax=Jatrophihabitans sp. TaxID=1932789 RepID=UPI002C0D829E|nr:class I SAM-dependent methyltransferase [Jatrophihabitans sp.]